MTKKNIYITKPHLPELSDFTAYLEEIWQSQTLSNCGPFHNKLEERLAEFLGTDHISLVNNGTIALLVAIKALDLVNAEIITTPYSFVATSNAILWTNNTPVFVDIESNSPNIDPYKIEAAITEKTKAILPVHCYGHPCNWREIEKIASKHNLKVVYDAAHSFGTFLDSGKSVLLNGDIATLSFHATKVFNTFEGGAIISKSKLLKSKVDSLRNFGLKGGLDVEFAGINSKMNEISAAFGLLQLKKYDYCWHKRREIDQLYRKEISSSIGITCIEARGLKIYNYSYFPILINSQYPLTRDQLVQRLQEKQIFPRKYFYPLISNLKAYESFHSISKENLPNANEYANKILCLPIFPDLPFEVVKETCEVINNA